MSTVDRLKAHRSLARETRDESLLKLVNLVLNEIRTYEISKGCHYKASEEEVQGIISKEVQARKELAASYHKAADSAQDEESRERFVIDYYDKLSEAGLLSTYLTPSELEPVVRCL